jgi:hypothetical protein
MISSERDTGIEPDLRRRTDAREIGWIVHFWERRPDRKFTNFRTVRGGFDASGETDTGTLGRRA